jgi:16S rRNA (cytidine1402-2'-O)-methyltransferase
MAGILYIVSTPIGNYEDITLRALRILKEVDLVVCEEFKEGKKLLHHYEIQTELESLNEHNEVQMTPCLLEHLRRGKKIALISDAGTPVFSDPGLSLVQKALEANIPVHPIPGPSSLMAALVVCGFDLSKFLYYGWLSPKKEIRRKELSALRKEKRPIVLLDTPYRLIPVLEDITVIFGPDREIAVALDLTLPSEEIRRGPVGEVRDYYKEKKTTGEFVIIINSPQPRRKSFE